MCNVVIRRIKLIQREYTVLVCWTSVCGEQFRERNVSYNFCELLNKCPPQLCYEVYWDSNYVRNTFSFSMGWCSAHGVRIPCQSHLFLHHRSFQLQAYCLVGLCSINNWLFPRITVFWTVDDVLHIWRSRRIWACNDLQILFHGCSATLRQVAFTGSWYCGICTCDRHARNDSISAMPIKCVWMEMDTERNCTIAFFRCFVFNCLCSCWRVKERTKWQ